MLFGVDVDRGTLIVLLVRAMRVPVEEIAREIVNGMLSRQAYLMFSTHAYLARFRMPRYYDFDQRRWVNVPGAAEYYGAGY